MAAGTMRPSQILRKLASYPRQNELAAALREVGRVERSLFMIDWTTDPDMRRRAQSGLNKGESHHALKRAINFHQRGELRDRTEEGQHYRIAGLNLLAAIIIYWNTLKLGEAVLARNKAGLEIPVEFLTHVSPLGWEHINLAQTARTCIYGHLDERHVNGPALSHLEMDDNIPGREHELGQPRHAMSVMSALAL